MADIRIAAMTVTVRRIGWLGFMEPWRAALPEPGERVVVDSDDLIGGVFSLGFPKGPPRIAIAYVEAD